MGDKDKGQLNDLFGVSNKRAWKILDELKRANDVHKLIKAANKFEGMERDYALVQSGKIIGLNDVAGGLCQGAALQGMLAAMKGK